MAASPRVVAIALFRNDLRLHDNAVLHQIHTLSGAPKPSCFIPLYVFDQRHVECSGLPSWPGPKGEAKTPLCGFWRTGRHRLKFLVETLDDLKQRLRRKGSDLHVRFGLPDQVTVNLVKALQGDGYKVSGVYMQKEVATEEIKTETSLEASLKNCDVPLVLLQTKSLVHPNDLPFNIEKTPDVFTPFRKQVEGLGHRISRDCLAELPRLLPLPTPFPTAFDAYGAEVNSIEPRKLLKYLLAPLGESIQNVDHRSVFPYCGGESAALQRLKDYFMGKNAPVATYKSTRNGLLGVNYSTKLSPFLALGSVSPRKCMQVLNDHEAEYGASSDTYWVLFELLWRDFFLFTAQRFSYRLFTLSGLEAVTAPRTAMTRVRGWKRWSTSPPEDLQTWLDGRTGVPFIDANLRELRDTGFMSNRGRQNVASFLTKDLYYDWRIGAEFFEHYLIDYDPAANYGNWQYIAGTGNDPRASRQFNPIKQAKDYDAEGVYVKTWLPELKNLPIPRVHTPWLSLAHDEGCRELRSADYPSMPVIEQNSWRRYYDRSEGDGRREGNVEVTVR